jgi:galactose mutarotase-like enzyme
MPSASWTEIVLRSRHLTCVVLPEKGAEIATLTCGAMQVLGRLRDTPAPDASYGTCFPGADEAAFNRWYAGGWQGLLPNGDAPCVVDGVRHSFHGESWGRAWTVLRADDESALLAVDIAHPPLRVTRELLVADDRAAIVVREEVENIGPAPARVLWGHHPVFGGVLAAPGAVIELPAGDLETVHCDATSRFADATGLRWPLPEVATVPEGPSHDLCLVTGFDTGRARVVAPDGMLVVTIDFDPTLFRWLWIWQLFGGAETEPFAGRRVLGIEPWTGPPSLQRAAADGHALALEPGTTRATEITLTIDVTEDPTP